MLSSEVTAPEQDIPLQIARGIRILSPYGARTRRFNLPPNCTQPRSSGDGRTPQIESTVPFTAVHAIQEFFYGSPPARLTLL